MRRSHAWGVLLSLLVLTGCSEDPYQLVPVSGKVTTCEGKPAAGGTVVFYPIDEPKETGRKSGNPGREARGTVDDNGNFTLSTIARIGEEPQPGVVAGRHRVAFEMPPTERPKLLEGEKEQMSTEEIQKLEAEFASRPVYPKIPCGTSLTPDEVTVKESGNSFEFTLNKK